MSAGGVVFRRNGDRVEVALIAVGDPPRWQLPKGLLEPGEAPDATAVREVREETGVSAELLEPLDTIEYWYVATEDGRRVRFHKFVHFFLLRATGGDVVDHDHEVREARWVEIGGAEHRLAFANERRVVTAAASRIATLA